MNVQIGIIGSEEKNLEENTKERYLKMAEEAGEILAEKRAILITGGCSGIVQAACRGAQRKGGITVGTPGKSRGSAIKETTVEICTPIETGDYLFAGILSCDSIIVFPGEAGTIAEIAIAYRHKKPLIFIREYKGFLSVIKSLFKSYNKNYKEYPFYIVENSKEAAELAYKIATESLLKGGTK